MTEPSIAGKTRALIEANGFDLGALEANRGGRLTPAQAALLRSRRRARGYALLVIGALLVGLGGWDLYEGSDDRWGALLAVIGGVVMIALRWSDFGLSYRAELAAGLVTWVDGRIEIRGITGDNHTMYLYFIGDREFQTTEEGAKEIDAKARYRVYHVPNTDMMVNIEVLRWPSL